INKYDDFYNAKYLEGTYPLNMLQLACTKRLDQVAIALIDKKCDLTYHNNSGYTALIYAYVYELENVTAHIIDNIADITTRKITCNLSEMMYICDKKNINNVIKMIDRGYDIYCKSIMNMSLFTIAVHQQIEEIVKKLIDMDTDFVSQFNIQYIELVDKQHKFYNDIMKYCVDKRNTIKDTIIATMNDATSTNALYKSFHKTYAVVLVDVICDFILLKL
ncbi:MAG: hypothetical protein Faunusvirus42_1, partial [Faunusvirus sp.]